MSQAVFYQKRSVEQNARYWAVVRKVADHTGYTEKEIHLFFKDKFLPGEWESTTQLSTSEMDYMTKHAMAWAGQTLGLEFR